MRRLIPILLLGAIACSNDEEAEKPQTTILLGAIVDRTGDIANPNWHPAIEMAKDQMNRALAASDLRNIAFEITLTDSKNTKTVAVEAAQELVSQGAKALILDSSPNTEGVASLNYDADPDNRLGVPTVSMATSSPFINDPDDASTDPIVQAARRDEDGWVFRTSMSSLAQTQVIMRILDEKGIMSRDPLKISVLGTKNAFGAGYVAAIAAAAKTVRDPSLSEAVVEGVFYVPSGTDGVPTDYDFADELDRLLDTTTEQTDATGTVTGETADGLAPDAVVDASNSGHNINVTRYYSGSAPLLHHDTFRRSQVIEGLGSAANGEEGTSPVLVDSSASGDAFTEALSDLGASELGAFDSVAYDAAATLMLATLVAAHSLSDPAEVTGEQIRDALETINDADGEETISGEQGFADAIALLAAGEPFNYEGASGNCDFDENGDARMKVAHWKVEQQEFVDVTTYDCVDPACPPVEEP